MKFRPVILGSLLAVSALGMNFLAVADDAATSTNASSLFLTKPVKTSSLFDLKSGFDQMDDPFRAPTSLFGGSKSSGDSSAPIPPPRIDLNTPEEHKNWMLLTPEQILGVKTAEQIMQVEKSDDWNRTDEEKFLDRQRQVMSGPTNSPGSSLQAHGWSTDNTTDPTVDQESQARSFSGLSRLMAGERKTGFFSDSDGQKSQTAFGLVRTADPEELQKRKDDMEAYRVLLGEMTAKDSSDKSGNNANNNNFGPVDTFNFLHASKAKSADNDNAFGLGVHGAMYQTASSEVSRPVGLDMPTAWTTPKKKAETPSWAPKPPPWLSQDPQVNMTPGVVPQRKF